jgi:pyruvate/2-oxoglutarate dehydrogenase complex dihydrolipoamide acyltransferase (E2) component
MKIEMKMPDLATTESEIKVTQWLVEIGQPIKRGEPLLEVETDKAAVEVESYVTGILKEILAEPEDEVDAGAVIAIIEIEGSTPPHGPAEHEEPIAKQQRPAPGGVAAELAAGIMERFGGYLMAPVVRVASADVPPPFAPALESAYRPDAARICEAARNVLTY